MNGESPKAMLYVSPELVISADGHYSKHFYAGTQRVVSKVCDKADFGTDPRTPDRAGEVDSLRLPLKADVAPKRVKGSTQRSRRVPDTTQKHRS